MGRVARPRFKLLSADPCPEGQVHSENGGGGGGLLSAGQRDNVYDLQHTPCTHSERMSCTECRQSQANRPGRL